MKLVIKQQDKYLHPKGIKTQQYWIRMVSNNGKIMMSSETYTQLSHAVRAGKALLRHWIHDSELHWTDGKNRQHIAFSFKNFKKV